MSLIPAIDADDSNQDSMNNARSFSWPPPSKFEPSGGVRLFRTVYDLELVDPESENSVTVIVGEISEPGGQATFCLPQAMLESSSEFFKNALSPRWAKMGLQPTELSPRRRPIELPNVSPAVFDLYARWLDAGAEILADKEEWKAAYTEYLRWQREIELEKEIFEVDTKKVKCPGTVWDFGLTTQAWFLGDFLKAPGFQNHCMGHLWWMQLRYDHEWCDVTLSGDTEGWWHEGTFAYVNLDDVVYTWEYTEHSTYNYIEGDQHPLRRFWVKWLAYYLQAYEINPWDRNACNRLMKLTEWCPNMTAQLLFTLSSFPSTYRCEAVGRLEDYYVEKVLRPTLPSHMEAAQA